MWPSPPQFLANPISSAFLSVAHTDHSVSFLFILLILLVIPFSAGSSAVGVTYTSLPPLPLPTSTVSPAQSLPSVSTPSASQILFLFLLLILLVIPFSAGSSAVGVTYPFPSLPSSTPSPPLDCISGAISSLRLHSLRLPNPDPSVVRSFAYTNTYLLLSIPNALLPPLASNKSFALRWLYGHVLPFYPRSKITLISVADLLSPFLLPAVQNMHLALQDRHLHHLLLCERHHHSLLYSAAFQQPLGDLLIKPLLQLLEATNSSFLVNLYPYNKYWINSEIPLGFSLFQEHPFNFRDDLVTGVR